MTFDEANKRLLALGYRLVKNRYCPIQRRKMPYARIPHNMPGAVCNFDNLNTIEEHIKRIEQIRAWQAEMPPVCEILDN